MDNKPILKKVNRISKGRKKAGKDGIKIVLIMVGMMAVIAVFFILLSNLELPQFTPTTNDPVHIEEIPDPEPIGDPFEGMRAGSMVTELIDEDMLFYPDMGGRFELPVIGSTGWVAAPSVLRGTSGADGEVITDLKPGLVFTIIDDRGDWWRVRFPDGETGWVDNRRCFINLPDILPSIIYSVSNAGGSLFRSNGYALPGITGERLYSARAYNERLGRYEYIVPGMFAFARVLFLAQQAALVYNESLVVYEVYRPQSAQTAIEQAMNLLMQTHASVYSAIVDSPWSLSWFASPGLSNHQRGAAVDASLARVNGMEITESGSYSFVRIVSHEKIETGSPIHELSPASAIVRTPRSISARQVINGDMEMRGAAITAGIKRMQIYFAGAGLNPMASKWWHFDHQAGVSAANASGIVGDFYTEEIFSEPPVR
jgi:D-alanyl-D-alanine dipeptidase